MIALSGILILSSLLITIYSYFIQESLFIYAGLLAWIALGLLFLSIKKKRMLIILLLLSLGAFLYSYLNAFAIDLKRVFTVNQYLLALLIGVGFLRLIATPKTSKIKRLPQGEKSFLKTYLGIHLFGSVINLSSLILVADKLYKKAPLSNLQLVVLTRAFSSDAYWSPFFVAFAAALTYAPNLQTTTILFNGLFLALIAFLITYIDAKRNFDLDSFKGYPIHFETLYLPFLLALLVLTTNYYYPNVKVIVLIASFSLLLTLVVLPLKKGMKEAIKKFSTHVLEELPSMKMELSLFLVAGMFGVSISSILSGMNIQVPFEIFSWIEASILLFIFILLSFIGIHPIITIAIIGDLMSEVNHTLLAVTFLMAWSTTVSTSPFSGLNLTIQARYDIKASKIFKVNIPYAIKMYFICVAILYFISKSLGI